MWQGWILLFVGLWLFFGTGLLKAAPGGIAVDYLDFGIVAFVLGLWAFVHSTNALRKWLSAIAALAGIWLGLSAYFDKLQGIGNALIVGAVLSVIGFWIGAVKSTAAPNP